MSEQVITPAIAAPIAAPDMSAAVPELGATPIEGGAPEVVAKEPTALEMAQLIKREQKLRKRELESKRALESERTEMQSKYGAYEKAAGEKSLAKRLELLGINYGDVTKELLSGDPASQVALEVQELKAQLADRDKREVESRQQAEQAQQQAALSEAKHQIASGIDNGGEFELVKAFKMSGAVAEHLTQRMMQGDTSLTAADVAATFEKQIESALEAAMTTSKGRQILAKLTPQEDSRGGQKHAQSRAGSTLTNAIAAMRVSEPEKTGTPRVRSFLEENADIAKRIASRLG